MEIWKQYRDTNYEASNLGNVRHKETKRLKTQFYKYNGKYDNDYVRVSLYIDGKDKNVPVHRMVAECFLDNYNDNMEVNHKNNLRWDNRLDNLEMTTKEQNYQYSLTNGSGSQRKPVYCLDKEGNRHEFDSLWQAARCLEEILGKKMNIDHVCNNIKQNLNGKSKTAYGYSWYWA